MYRDDHQATLARAESLERELRDERAGRTADRARIVELEAQLSALRRELGRMPRHRTRRPADATLVMVLGLLSLFIFPVLGPVAWYLGNRELQAIEVGEADPADRGKLQLGRVTGMVGTILLVLGMMFALWAAWAVSALFHVITVAL